MPEAGTQKPLISIVIITYNSSAFVRETLESAKRQTYDGPIELIISDDCSKDDTVSVCREWIAENASRFERVELIAGQENIGVSKNINRGCRASRGEWIKTIAGDDIFTDDCLEAYYRASCEPGEARHFFFAHAYSFHTGDDLSHPEKLEPWGNHIAASVIDLEYACRDLWFWLCAPSFFSSRKMLEDIGYFPEIFRNVEDAPFLRKVVAAGYRMYQLPKPTVFYRLSEVSITTNFAAVARLTPTKIRLICIDRYLRPALGTWGSLTMYWRLIFTRLYVATGEKYAFLWKWHWSLEKRLNQWASRKSRKKTQA